MWVLLMFALMDSLSSDVDIPAYVYVTGIIIVMAVWVVMLVKDGI